MTKQILHLHLAKDEAPQDSIVSFLDETFKIRSVGTGGNIDTITRLIEEADADPGVHAIALDGITGILQLGREQTKHIYADRLESASQSTPLVSGHGVRGAFERWAIRLVNAVRTGHLHAQACALRSRTEPQWPG